MQPGQSSSSSDSKIKKKLDSNTITNIQMRICTRERLKTFGIKGENYDLVLNRMMDKLEGK
jgi:hypothetical protein